MRAYDMRISYWSSDVCSSVLVVVVLAVDVELVGLVEVVLVEVATRGEQADTVALLDQLAVDLDVLERHPLEDRDRGCPANDLVDSRVRTVRLVVLPLLGVVEEGVHAVRDGVAGGLVAGH